MRRRAWAFVAWVTTGSTWLLVPACRELIGLDAYYKEQDATIPPVVETGVDAAPLDVQETIDTQVALDTFDATPTDPCRACLRSFCTFEYDNCQGDLECQKYLQCFSTCPSTCNPDACFCRCGRAHQVGKAATTLAVCLYLELTSETGPAPCLASCGPGGDAAIPDYGVTCDAESDSGRCR